MKLLYIIFGIIIISSCSSVQKINSSGEKFKISKELNQFLTDFETASQNHNTKNVLNLMDKAYKKEQHNEMLEGRTDQFLNEFFAGTQTNGKGFKVLNFETITSLDFSKITQTEEDTFEIFYIVKTSEYQIKCQWEIKLRIINGKNVFGLVGASG